MEYIQTPLRDIQDELDLLYVELNETEDFALAVELRSRIELLEKQKSGLTPRALDAAPVVAPENNQVSGALDPA